MPDLLSRRALEIAEHADDPDVLADALLGRALAFSGVAVRATESIELLDRLAALPHERERLNAVVRHGLLSMAHATLGDLDCAQEHARRGAEGSDTLRLPVTRVQFRWAEGTFATWHGDFAKADRLYEQAFQLHEQTELYRAGVHHLAQLTLRWQQGRLAELEIGDDDSASDVPWEAVCFAAEQGDAADVSRLIAATLASPGPVNWMTHGHFTILAHIAADLGLASFTGQLLERLEPVREFVATIGQVSMVGPVALATARLRWLTGDRIGAQRDLDLATAVAERGGSRPSLLACSLLALVLADPPPDDRDAALATIAAEAAQLGAPGLAVRATGTVR